MTKDQIRLLKHISALQKDQSCGAIEIGDMYPGVVCDEVCLVRSLCDCKPGYFEKRRNRVLELLNSISIEAIPGEY